MTLYENLRLKIDPIILAFLLILQTLKLNHFTTTLLQGVSRQDAKIGINQQKSKNAVHDDDILRDAVRLPGWLTQVTNVRPLPSNTNGRLKTSEYGDDQPLLPGFNSIIGTNSDDWLSAENIWSELSISSERDILSILIDDIRSNEDESMIVDNLISHFQSLRNIMSASKERLLSIPGVTPRVYSRIIMIRKFTNHILFQDVKECNILTSWEKLVKYWRAVLSLEANEQIHIMYLNNKNALISSERNARGTVDHAQCYPREIIKRALELNASSIILVQNRALGEPTLRKQDQAIITQLQSACLVFGILLRGHLIVGRSRVRSRQFPNIN